MRLRELVAQRALCNAEGSGSRGRAFPDAEVFEFEGPATMSRAFLAMTVALGMPSAALAVSPSWCGSADLNPSETTICIDGILSRLDVELNEAYDRAKEVEPDIDQASWLARRDECGTDVSCLETAYRTRISELRAIASARREAPSRRTSGLVPDPGAITVTPLPDAETSPVRPENPRPRHRGTDSELVAQLEALLREQDGRESARVQQEGREDVLIPDRRVAPEILSEVDEMIPRPWCDARRLNATERTICADADLSRLDALLELAYGRTTARDDDSAQIEWLRSERDACGTDIGCIAMAYDNRIEALDLSVPSAPDRRRDIFIPAGHYPPPGACRVWYPDRPPGHQPPPTSCDVQVPAGAVLIRG